MDGVSKYGYAFFPVALFYELKRLVSTVTPLLGRIKAPMLLIHPRDDDTASARNSQLIHDRISSAKKRLVILEDSYHVITADQEREKVAREMVEFLNQL
jgi:carboxylesterase